MAPLPPSSSFANTLGGSSLRPIVALLALLFVIPAYAGDPVKGFHLPRSPVKTKHLVPVLHDGDGYGEKYTFDADFGDRGSFYFSMTITNLGLGSHKMEAKGRLTVDGHKFKWKKQLDDDDWKHSKSPFSIKAGPAGMSGTPQKLLFTAAKGSEKLEITYTPIANAWRPLNGQIRFKGGNVSDYTVFPLSTVSARYDFGDGWKTIEGKGWGTHSWSDIAIYEQARWTMEFRGIEGDTAFYIREMGTGGGNERKRVAYLLVTKGADVLVESYDYTLKPTELLTDTKHENHYKVPESFDLQGADVEYKTTLFRGKVTKKKLRKRKNMLGNLNAAVRMVASRFTKPMSYEYDANYHLEIKTAAGVQTVKGLGRLEVYHWNK